MRRQLKPVKRGVERSEYEEKVRRRGGERGEETKRRAPRIRSDGARECQTGRGAAKECTSFNQGCRYKAGSVKWMKCWSYRIQGQGEKKRTRGKEEEKRDEERERGEANRRARAGGASPDAAGDLQQRQKCRKKARANAGLL